MESSERTTSDGTGNIRGVFRRLHTPHETHLSPQSRDGQGAGSAWNSKQFVRRCVKRCVEPSERTTGDGTGNIRGVFRRLHTPYKTTTRLQVGGTIAATWEPCRVRADRPRVP